jgi:hypothetical protein
VPHADLEADVISEELGEPVPAEEVRPLPERAPRSEVLPALREVRTAAIAAAGGAIAGVATVAAVRAVSASSKKRPTRRSLLRGERPANVVASRSFLVDVHVLGR